MTVAAVAVISAGALRTNLARIRALAPGCRVLAVIKANAYGHGLVDVARILADADALAVARLEEASQIRSAGIAHPRIVVLGGFVGAAEAVEAAALRVEPVIHTLEQVDVLEAMGNLPRMALWLKVDTGMHRLGIAPDAVPGARLRLERWLQGRAPLCLMTHLATADRAGCEATAEQLDQFAALSTGWNCVSMANSAAILQWPSSVEPGRGAVLRETWVRPGLMLYGVSPLPGSVGRDLRLRPAMRLSTRLIATKTVPKGAGLGYGLDWRAPRKSLIGIAAAGYADGYPWHSAVATPASVGGVRVPVVGRVSMDMINLDLTDHPGAHPGDEVALWGSEDLPVEEVAASAGSIPYVLLSGTSPRVQRRMEPN